MKDKLKFKKLLNEYRSLESEFEYNSEVLRESGEAFECTYLKWCEDNGVDFQALYNKKNKTVAMPPPQAQQEATTRFEPKDKQTKHKDVFKSVAKKIHPDKLKSEDPRQEEYTTAFQRATAAMNEGQWGELFDVIDKYEIDIPDYEEANESLEKDIKRMQEKLKGQKSTYTWFLQNCEDDPSCKDMVIQAYLKQVFGWDGSKGA